MIYKIIGTQSKGGLKMLKKILSLVLYIFLLSTFICMPAYAVEENTSPKSELLLMSQDEQLNFMQEKERLAKAYATARRKNDLTLAEEILAEYKNLTNAKSSFDVSARSLENTATIFSNWQTELYDIQHIPQENSYYCGPAAAQMILKYKGINRTQTQLASLLGTTQSGGTGWFLMNGNTLDQFPMAVTLGDLSGFPYQPAPFGNLGENPLSVAELEDKVWATIDADYGVALCGTSQASGTSHLPGYPNRAIGHWLVCYGWAPGDEQAFILDPAKSSAVSWSSSISASYEISFEKLAAFVAPKGIIW